MVDFFYKMYFLAHRDNKLLDKIRFFSLLRFITRLSANIVLPFYFIITRKRSKYKLIKTERSKGRIIVSFTSFPARINRIWLMLESVLRQELKPDMVILWLSKDQFESYESLPPRLLKMRDRGIDIRFCDGDLRSHKKYYYAMQEYPDDLIITLDDDIFYYSHVIKDLVQMNHRYPEVVCCIRARQIETIKDQIVPYKNWITLKEEKGPCYNILPTGVGGVLYPPASLHKDVFNLEVSTKLCFLADDIWLNAMVRLQGTKTAKASDDIYMLPIMYYKENNKLTTINVDGGQNDLQIKNIRDYYIRAYKIDLYKDLLKD